MSRQKEKEGGGRLKIDGLEIVWKNSPWWLVAVAIVVGAIVTIAKGCGQ